MKQQQQFGFGGVAPRSGSGSELFFFYQAHLVSKSTHPNAVSFGDLWCVYEYRTPVESWKIAEGLFFKIGGSPFAFWKKRALTTLSTTLNGGLPRNQPSYYQMMSKWCPITETKRRVLRFHALILGRWLESPGVLDMFFVFRDPESVPNPCWACMSWKFRSTP